MQITLAKVCTPKKVWPRHGEVPSDQIACGYEYAMG
jgi:hypothetical protein